MPNPLAAFVSRLAPQPDPARERMRAEGISRMDLARAVLEQEEPDLMRGVSVSPPGTLGSLLTPPNATAWVNPLGGGIYYNPEYLISDAGGTARPDQGKITDILRHELQHIKQRRDRGRLGMAWDMLTGPDAYRERPQEIDAFRAEAERAAHRRDIPLPRRRR